MITAVPSTPTLPAVSENVPEVEPAPILTMAGTGTIGLLLASDSAAPAEPAAWLKSTVQLPEAPDERAAGLQARELMVGSGAVRVSEAVREAPFKAAVTVAAWSLEMAAAVAAKLAEADPAATSTLGGRLKTGLLLASETAAPAELAALSKLTIQTAEAPDESVVGLHANDEITGGGDARLSDTVREVPLRVAVTVAPWFPATSAAAAMKLAEAAPAATVRVGGTERFALLLARLTVVLPAAAALKATTQEVEPGVLIVVGVQFSEIGVNRGCWVITPPAPPIRSALPSIAAPIASPIPSVDPVTDGCSRIVATATTPSLMMLLLIPLATQTSEPAPAAHDSDFPAFMSAGPAVTDNELTSVAE